MAEVRGKFIELVASLLDIHHYHKALKTGDDYLYSKHAIHWKQLKPEHWYDTSIYNTFIDAFVSACPADENGYITIGKLIYPTILKTTGFPSKLREPLDFITFESQGYLNNVRGPDIQPRKIDVINDNHIRVQLVMNEQSCMIMNGVYIGLLAMIGKTQPTVDHVKCTRKGDAFCEFHIQW